MNKKSISKIIALALTLTTVGAFSGYQGKVVYASTNIGNDIVANDEYRIKRYVFNRFRKSA